MERFLLILCLLCSTLTFGIGANAENTHTVSLPEPTGRYGVGTLALPLVDCSRPGLVDAQGKKHPYREMMIQIWYPANRGVTGKTAYLDDITAKLSAQTFPTVASLTVKNYAVINAPAANQRFPVLVFSPGYQNNSQIYQSFLEDIASYGYIVIGINHPAISAWTVFPDGHYYLSPPREDIKEPFKQVVADFQFVAHQLWQLNLDLSLPIAQRMNLWNIGSFGHSLGGAAAVQAGIDQPQYLASLNLDGAMWGDDYQKPVYKPMILVKSDQYADGSYNWEELWNNMQRGYKVKVINSEHLSFSDAPLILPELLTKNSIAPEKMIQITRDIVRQFFDTYLKGQEANQILNLREKYPEVSIEAK